MQWSWKDVALECEHVLGPLGYKAVQVRAASACCSCGCYNPLFMHCNFMQLLMQQMCSECSKDLH